MKPRTKRRLKILLIVAALFAAFLIWQYVSAIRWAGEITEKAAELGMTAEEYQALEYAVSQAGK